MIDVRSNASPTNPAFAYETSDCFSSSYATAVAFLGMDPRLLGCEWGYYAQAREVSSAWPFGGTRIWRHSFDELVDRWYGIHCAPTHHRTSEQARQRITAALDEGRPIIVSVDQYVVRHTMFYRLLHYPHLFVLSARRGDDVLVLDGVRGHAFADWLPLADVLQAMGTDSIVDGMWGFDGRNTTIEPWPQRRHQVSAEAVRTELTHNIDDYLDGGHDSGARVAVELLHLLRAFPVGDETEPVAETLSSGALFVGELASQRQLNAAFLELCDEYLGVGVAEHASFFTWMSEELVKTRWAFFFGIRAGRPAGQLTTTLANRLAALTEAEHDQMRALRKRLRPRPR